MPIVRSSEDSPPATRLDGEAVAQGFAGRLGDDCIASTVAYGQATVQVTPAALPRAARIAKQDPVFAMDFFDMMAGVDLGEDGFAVVTRLYSTTHRHEVLLRAVAEGGREDPRLPSITGVYRGANWHERECYDMFGITFEGHPGLEPRILTVENFEGWPLRKDFLLTSREIKHWPGEKEPKEAAPEDGGGEGGEAAAADAPSAEEKAAAAKEKAERAKRKAAEMRAKKAAERAQQDADDDAGGGEGS